MKMSLPVWILTTLLLFTLPSTALSQGDITACDSGFSFITQPPEAFPCNPYPSSAMETGSVMLECSVTVPQNLITASRLIWNKVVGVDHFEQGRVASTESLVYRVSEETESVVLLRSILEVTGLNLNTTDCVGMYFCRVHVSIGGETVFSNTSTVTHLLNSTAYTDLDRCSNKEGGVFLSEASQCLSLSSNISLPPPPPPPPSGVEEPPTSCHDTPTSSCSTTSSTSTPMPTPTPPPFTMETIIIIASVGGGLAILVVFLLFVLLITCCCLRKPDRSKASLRTFKDRSIPLSASMSNINVIESATSQSNLVTAPIQVPLSTQRAPSHPPPVRTLPTRGKQTVTQKDSSCSISSTTALIRKGRAATVVGKLKTACTPTDENSVPIGGGKSKFETGPVYKSLIVRNMDDAPIYTTASLNGSMEHLDKIDNQPVYSEPNIPLSVSMLSLISEQDNEQPQYSEPIILSHSVSSMSLHSPLEKTNNGSALTARSRLSLPLNKKLSVSPFMREEQPIYSEVNDWMDASPQRQYMSSSNESSPIKRKPIVPPRPHGRQTNKPLSLPETVNQSECSIQRESVDGEYVCPNGVVNVEAVRGRGRSSSDQPRGEVVQLRNHDIAPPPHMTQGDRHGYLTLYMTS